MDIDKQLENLAKKLRDGASSGWLWKLLIGVAAAFLYWYLKHQLKQQGQELAESKAQLAVKKLDTEREDFEASIRSKNSSVEEADKAIAAARAEVRELECALTKSEEKHLLRVETLKKIKEGDWDALNQLAGAP